MKKIETYTQSSETGQNITLIYDGSFNGFLTAVYIAFENKIEPVGLQKSEGSQKGFFSVTETIGTNTEQAKLVWNGIRAKSHNAMANIYFAFLSGANGVEMLCYDYIKSLMCSDRIKQTHGSNEIASHITRLALKVGQEKRRMETFTHFKRSKDQVYYAVVRPDHDILPLISKHFRMRYTDQPWFIYDIKRQYGIFYDLDKVKIVSFTLNEIEHSFPKKAANYTPVTNEYHDQCDQYFKNSAIKSQIHSILNTHIPKRNWKYSSEKRQAV